MLLHAERLPARLSGALLAPSTRSPDRTPSNALARRAVSVLCLLGLFTLSWERFGNIGAGPYNLKLPVVFLTLAAVLGIPQWWATLQRIWTSLPSRSIVLLAAAAVLMLVGRAATAPPLVTGLAQVLAVATGAVAPALAVCAVVGNRADVLWALRWLIAGAAFASAFGLYQLFAFYTGLPQIVTYTGVGTSGGVGRIAAFSYEPAYLAYFLVLACTAVITLSVLQAHRVRWATMAFFALMLVLVNVRALLFMLPVTAVLLLVSFRQNRRVVARTVAVAVVFVLGSFVVPAAVDAIATQIPTNEQSTPDGGSKSPSKGPEAGPRTHAPESPKSSSPPDDVLDPSEPTSNAPRLELYRAVLRVDQDHLAFGVGPGQLRSALRANGYTAPNQGGQVVANDIWLQAGADGGVLLVVLELALVAVVVALWWALRHSAMQPLASGWLAVVLVGGALASYFFDIKVWVVLALILCLASDARSTRPDRSRGATL